MPLTQHRLVEGTFAGFFHGNSKHLFGVTRFQRSRMGQMVTRAQNSEPLKREICGATRNPPGAKVTIYDLCTSFCKTMVTVFQMGKVLRLVTFRLSQDHRMRYDYLNWVEPAIHIMGAIKRNIA